MMRSTGELIGRTHRVFVFENIVVYNSQRNPELPSEVKTPSAVERKPGTVRALVSHQQ